MKAPFPVIFLSVLVFLCGALSAAPKEKLVVVRGPTVIAFLTLNEALSDFQVYVERVREQLEGMGIAFEEVYEASFVVKCDEKTRRFRPKMGVGYYFVAPDKPPHVEYGVRSDGDILQIAKEHFHPTPK